MGTYIYGMKKKGCFSMVPHIIHPSFLHNKDGGLVGGCCWFTLAILVTIWFRVFCKPLLLLCFPWVELVGARKETKLFGKNLEQQQQQTNKQTKNNNNNKTFTKLSLTQKLSVWEDGVRKGRSPNMSVMIWKFVEDLE
jgi:hypothetical protein